MTASSSSLDQEKTVGFIDCSRAARRAWGAGLRFRTEDAGLGRASDMASRIIAGYGNERHGLAQNLFAARNRSGSINGSPPRACVRGGRRRPDRRRAWCASTAPAWTIQAARSNPAKRLEVADAGAPADQRRAQQAGRIRLGPARGRANPAARLLTRANLVGDAQHVDAHHRAPASRRSAGSTRTSRGLLLLSEDGVLAKAVIGPTVQAR